MTLKENTREVLQQFDATNSDRIIGILSQIQPQLKSSLTRDYLGGKIQGIRDVTTESEKKKMCRALIPYLEWYLQGN